MWTSLLLMTCVLFNLTVCQLIEFIALLKIQLSQPFGVHSLQP
jgi:hypothetical protein